jgi:hypothetical protein
MRIASTGLSRVVAVARSFARREHARRAEPSHVPADHAPPEEVTEVDPRIRREQRARSSPNDR